MKINQRTKVLAVISLILPVGLILHGCTTTYNIRSFQVEIMKPAPFSLSEEMDTIAIFNRDIYQSDTIDYKYRDAANYMDVYDSLVQYRALANQCVEALSIALNNAPYFRKVINYSDSLRHLLPSYKNRFTYDSVFHKQMGADVCIFLDHFTLKDQLINRNVKNLGIKIFHLFPEFKSSTQLESIEPKIIWTRTVKQDKAVHVIEPPEKLFYGSNLYPELFGNDEKHRLLLASVAEHLGRSFTSYLIPSMQQEERRYYRSNNKNMLLAERYLLEGDWLKAAEIYKRLTSNKNPDIVAKSTYNMALICEMEGKMDAASNWLSRSFSTYKRPNPRHQFHCFDYGNLLANRKEEMYRLEQQMEIIKSLKSY